MGAYYGQVVRKGSCLEIDIIQGYVSRKPVGG